VGGILHLGQLRVGGRPSRIYEQADDGGRRNELAQHLQSLGEQRNDEVGDACRVATGLID
jgi:hypothetical protein